MNKPIILIANTCPFGGEVFLKNELEYISPEGQVYLFPILTDRTQPPADWDKPQIRVMPAGAHPNGPEKLAALIHGLFAPFCHGELGQILAKPNPLRNYLKAVKFAFLGDSRARAIRRCLQEEGITDPVFYSYWLYESAYAALRLRRYYPGSPVVSRCHGYDVYEVRHPGGYLPFRPWLTAGVDRLCPISQDGAEYVGQRYPGTRLAVSRLGTADHGPGPVPGDGFTLVSCSNLLEVKRLDLLIRGLALCRIPVRWLHFGDGPLKESLLKLAESLPENICWQFMGGVPNPELMAFYRENPVDAFINVSSSEGVPVSIMEAMSFGIPAIATDVGGTHEIVLHEKNGLLIPADATPETVAAAVERMASEASRFRENARSLWQQRYDAAANYREFYEMLDQIGE